MKTLVARKLGDDGCWFTQRNSPTVRTKRIPTHELLGTRETCALHGQSTIATLILCDPEATETPTVLFYSETAKFVLYKKSCDFS